VITAHQIGVRVLCKLTDTELSQVGVKVLCDQRPYTLYQTGVKVLHTNHNSTVYKTGINLLYNQFPDRTPSDVATAGTRIVYNKDSIEGPAVTVSGVQS
jgi:hypothetical protein